MSDIESPETTPVVQLADEPATVPAKPSLFADTGKLLIPAAILIAGVLVSGSIFITNYQNQVAAIKAPNAKPAVGAKVNINLDGAPFLGNANAPVTIVEFADFQCPYCKRYFDNNQALFVSEYVDKGKARFVWKDYAFLGQESSWSAEAARCANDQGKFWEYHNYLYSQQGAENSGAFSKVNLKKFASALKLDTAQFNTCLDSGKYTALIQQEGQTASGIGVNGTPATFINGKLVVGPDGNSVGAAPFATFQAIIDNELKK